MNEQLKKILNAMDLAGYQVESIGPEVYVDGNGNRLPHSRGKFVVVIKPTTEDE